MWLNNLNLRGILANSSTSETEYIFLPDQSVALIGPNGVGKSSFVEGLQRAFKGVAEGPLDPFGIQLDLIIPPDLEDWCENNGDFGIVRAVYNLVTGESANIQGGEDFSPSNERFHEALKNRWKDSIHESFSRWHEKLGNLPPEELIENENIDPTYRLLAIRDLLESIIEEGTLYPERKEHWEKSLGVKLESNSNFNDRKKTIVDSIEKISITQSFIFSPVGNVVKPEWSIDCVARIPVSNLTEFPELKHYAETFVLPKTLGQSSKFRGYFGVAKPDVNEKEVRSTYIRFIEDEIWFGMNLGITSIPTGIKLVNPDEIALEDLMTELLELINLPLTFSENELEIAFWNVAQLANSDWQFRNYNKEGVGFAPFESDFSFNQKFERYVDFIASTITDHLNEFLPGSPRFSIVMNRKELWITRGLLEFEARDGYVTYPLTKLSDTQQRWLKVAIYLTLYPPFALALFIDEPERGLQKKVEGPLLNHLVSIQEERLAPIFVATHSAEVISHCASTIQISKEQDGTRNIRRTSRPLHSILNDLGLTEEEYFQSKRLLVLTEGIMDKAMLDGFASEKFQRNNIEIVSGYGLNSWSAYYDSKYLKRASGMKLLFIADSVDTSKLEALNIQAKALNQPQGMNYFYRNNIQKCVNENWSRDQLHIVGTIVAEACLDNFETVGLDSTGDRDCLMWLPPESWGLTPGTSWNSLIAEFNKEPNGGSTGSWGERFKAFLKLKLKQKGIKNPLDSRRLQTICAEVAISGQIPDSIGALIDRIVKFSVP
jgi:ABC-type cobalamin/Fe3+-siderophores transport system ATPase subunit